MNSGQVSHSSESVIQILAYGIVANATKF